MKNTVLLFQFLFFAQTIHGQNDSGTSTIRRTNNDNIVEVTFHQ